MKRVREMMSNNVPTMVKNTPPQNLPGTSKHMYYILLKKGRKVITHKISLNTLLKTRRDMVSFSNYHEEHK